MRSRAGSKDRLLREPAVFNCILCIAKVDAR